MRLCWPQTYHIVGNLMHWLKILLKYCFPSLEGAYKPGTEGLPDQSGFTSSGPFSVLLVNAITF